MTNAADAQQGVTEALGDLGEQTKTLVRAELDAVRAEMWDKAKAGAPALALGGAAVTLGLCAGASTYRLSLRVLERMMSPTGAALLATLGYSGAAAYAAVAAARRLRDLPPPLPTETARRTGEAALEEVGG